MRRKAGNCWSSGAGSCFCAVSTSTARLNIAISENDNEAPPACSAGGAISYASKTVSRVLYLTAIYLDALLPVRSSHLLEAAGQACCFRTTVLLRIEFTASPCSHVTGELLPRLSTLTGGAQRCQRYISVALFLRSLWAGVTRYPCPVEPGLSS